MMEKKMETTIIDWGVCIYIYIEMGGCPNYGPFLGSLLSYGT